MKLNDFFMHYMITERFHPGKVKALYQRFAEKGRMLPEGVEYVNSWVSDDLSICWQIMTSRDRFLLDQWISQWSDLASFEVTALISSAEAKELALR